MVIIIIKVYSSGCPKCKILEKKLQQHNIEFETINDFDSDELIKRGFYSLPIADINGDLHTFQETIQWIDDNY